MNDHRRVEGDWLLLEPGDGTRYEFLVVPVPKDAPAAEPALFIASVARGHMAPSFVGYAYNVCDLLAFAERYPRVVRAGRDDYRAAVVEAKALDDYHIGYAMEHSGTARQPANPWTCLSAFRAALHVLGVAPLELEPTPW